MVTLCCVSLNSRQLENRLACVACLHRADCRIAQGAKITLTASQAALKIGRTTRRTTVRGCLCSTLQVVLQKKKKKRRKKNFHQYRFKSVCLSLYSMSWPIEKTIPRYIPVQDEHDRTCLLENWLYPLQSDKENYQVLLIKV